MKTHIALAGTLLAAALAGCGGGEDGSTDPIDTALLAQYRAAIPSMAQVTASAPEASVATALGDTATLPQSSYELVTGINGAVAEIVGTMRDLVMVEPTLYNSETLEFFWGPVPNADGVGYVAAYIRDAGESADFRYHYALLRGVDNDVSNLEPVIWGGATPSPGGDDHGVGITLWDFEANAAWEETNNPQPGALDRGRFVAVYSKQADADGNAINLVYSVFRSFVPADTPDAAPADLDYLYGRIDGADNDIDFIDWAGTVDVTQPADGTAENLSVRMAFLNQGAGRAEAAASGGSLQPGEELQLVECWGNAIERSYFSISQAGGAPAEEGTVSACGLFEASLTELGLPSLADVPAELKSELARVAQSGVPAS